jgi:hypothetical protein
MSEKPDFVGAETGADGRLARYLDLVTDPDPDAYGTGADGHREAHEFMFLTGIGSELFGAFVETVERLREEGVWRLAEWAEPEE